MRGQGEDPLARTASAVRRARSSAEVARILEAAHLDVFQATKMMRYLKYVSDNTARAQAHRWMKENVKGLDLIYYSSLISIEGKSKGWHRAFKWYAEMTEMGIPANTITYNSLISACEKGGEWERAFEVFADMQKSGVEADTITYRLLLRNLNGMQETGLEVSKDLLDIVAELQRYFEENDLS
ncbi:hypothetical protein CYMTET_49794 [Cymbomonas tetramitiformis]|uniref:Pentatricopeptide repeat-containing protein n=1 Tax=Cymbomonas tetramitiformis TaxID=36881 RepID=A0AAE0BPI2_9CHLO|nr:hypothetical protein CYMTET_49794 [Cymbomonas tetramitiformis]